MLIVLPKQYNGLPGLLKTLLDPASLPVFKKPFNKSTFTSRRFMFNMPKFTLGGESTDLVEKLKPLGMNDVFTNRADFSGMNGEKRLRIDKVMHQAVIEVISTSYLLISLE